MPKNLPTILQSKSVAERIPACFRNKELLYQLYPMNIPHHCQQTIQLCIYPFKLRHYKLSLRST